MNACISTPFQQSTIPMVHALETSVAKLGVALEAESA